MALVGEADFLGDHSQRAIGSAHQSFCPFDPPLHHVTLRSHTNRLLEAAAEMVGTETGHARQIDQGQPLFEVRLMRHFLSSVTLIAGLLLSIGA